MYYECIIYLEHLPNYLKVTIYADLKIYFCL